jgi:cytokinin dehydrogenase
MRRRTFMAGVAAGAVVVGFDPARGRWVVASGATELAYEPLPDLDGVVVMDDESLSEASADEGHMVRRRPWAVLRPGSAEDIAAMMRYCARNRLSAAARGTAHSIYGQPLVEAGLVVETGTLATIHEIGADRADVDAGVQWYDLFAATVEVGLTPPVYTGYTAMTVGGTLSVGGVGTGPREGVQVDRVQRLQVVTGDGQVRWCSETVRPDLFHGVLAGLGEIGIVTRAVVDLVPAPSRVRHWTLMYTDPHVFFQDLQTMADRGELDTVLGQIAFPLTALVADPSPLVRPLGELLPVIEAITGPLARGVGSVVAVPGLGLPTPWMYLLNVGAYYEPGDPPDGDHLLRGLRDVRALRQSLDRTYLEHVYRIDELVGLLEAAGLWNDTPHPWVDVFVPGQEAERFVADTFTQLRFDDLGLAGFGLVFPIHKAHLSRRFLTVPESDTDWIYLVDVLTSAPIPGDNSAFVAEKLARNRRIYERARDVGGTLYPISAVDMTPDDWAVQYGPRYAELARLKRRYDPDRVLRPGRRVFD